MVLGGFFYSAVSATKKGQGPEHVATKSTDRTSTAGIGFCQVVLKSRICFRIPRLFGFSPAQAVT
jgi:hypothetical protein